MPWHLSIHITNHLHAWDSARYHLHLPVQVACTQQLSPVHPIHHHTLSPTADVYTLPPSPLCSWSLQPASHLLPRILHCQLNLVTRCLCNSLLDSCIHDGSLPCTLISDKHPTDHTTTKISGNLRSTFAINLTCSNDSSVLNSRSLQRATTLECQHVTQTQYAYQQYWLQYRNA